MDKTRENIHENAQNRTFADLIKELRDETTLLIKQEVALAKTEVSEKVSLVMRNVLYIALGGSIAFAGLIFLILAVNYGSQVLLLKMGLSADIAMWLAPLIIGIIVCAIGYGFIQKAISTLSHSSLALEKTADSLKEDKQWIENKVT